MKRIDEIQMELPKMVVQIAKTEMTVPAQMVQAVAAAAASAAAGAEPRAVAAAAAAVAVAAAAKQ